MKTNRIVSLIIILILFQIGSGTANAQDLTVKQANGKAFKPGKAGILGDVIPMSNHDYLSITSVSRQSLVRHENLGFRRMTYVEMHYNDDNLRLVKKVVPEFKLDNKIMIYEGLFRMKKGFMLFLSYDNMKKKKRYLFAGWYDPESLSFQSDPVMIAEIKLAERGYWQERFEIVIGEDKESFLVSGFPPMKFDRGLFGPRFDDDRKFSKFDFWVYNDQMTLMNFREDYRFEYEGEKRIKIDQMLFDRSGNVYVLGAIKLKYISGRRMPRKGDQEPMYEGRYVVLQLRTDNTDIAYEPSSESVIMEARMKMQDDGNHISIAGVEGVVADEKAYVTSILYDVIALDSFRSIASASYDYPDELYDTDAKPNERRSRSSRSAARQEKKKIAAGIPEKSISSFGGIAVFEISPKGIPLIVIEQKYIKVVTTTTTDQNGTTSTKTTYYYHYQDAIASTINNDQMSGVRIEKDHYLMNIDIGTEITGTVNGKEAYLLADDLVYKLDLETNELSSGKLNLSTASGKSRSTRSKKRKAKGGTNIRFVNVHDISQNEFIAFQYLKASKVVMHKITF